MNESGLSRRTTVIILALLLLGGLYLRLVSVRGTVIDAPFRADAKDYVSYALNMKHSGIYSRDDQILLGGDSTPRPDSVRTPGYPLFLYPMADSENLPVFYAQAQYAQALLSAATIGLVFLLGRFLVSDIGGLIAAALTSITPHLIVFNSYLLTEPLFTFLLVLAFAIFALGRSPARVVHWGIFSAVLAWAILTRPSLEYFVAFLAIYLWLISERGRRLKIVLAATLPSLLAIVAWGAWAAVSTGGMDNSSIAVGTIHHGIYPDFMYRGNPESYGFPYRFDPDSEEIAKSLGAVLRTLWERAAEEPVVYLRWYALKAFHIFDWSIIQGQGGAFIYPALTSPYYDQSIFIFSHQFMQVIHAPIIVLALLGVLTAWLPGGVTGIDEYRLAVVRVIALLILYFLLVHVAGAPFPRYGVPLRPLLYIMALFFLATVFWHIQAWRRGAKRFSVPSTEINADVRQFGIRL